MEMVGRPYRDTTPKLAPGLSDGRTCANCEALLVRRRFATQPEPYAMFARRRFCSNACVGAARQRTWVDSDGPPWTETNSCWVWDRSTNANGYGTVATGDGRQTLAYLWLYEIVVGPVPEGLQLDHTCRNRACVNPAHLEPVTPAENVRRGRLAKLTFEDARAIRASHLSHVSLALRYGVSPSAIRHIRAGRTWREEVAA